TEIQIGKKAELLDRIRLHRYESGMTNAGAYDYAHDVKGYFKEFAVIPTTSIAWGAGTQDPDSGTSAIEGGLSGGFAGEGSAEKIAKIQKGLDEQIQKLQNELAPIKIELNAAEKNRNS